MIYSLIFSLSAGILDGTTVVNQTIPAAADDTGLQTIPVVGNLGRIDPQMLWPLVGPGGFLLCGVGITVPGATTMEVGLVGRTAGSVMQMLPGFPIAAGAAIPYVERPCYVPPQYLIQIFGNRVVVGEWTVRLDIAPLKTIGQAARAQKVVRPLLFGTPETP